VTKEISFKREIKSGIVYAILSFLLLTGWSLASPPGSSPDEDLHLSSVWYLALYPKVIDPSHPLRDDKIPLRITDVGKCYFNNPNVTSICEIDNSLSDANYSRIINNSEYYAFFSNFVSPAKIDMSTLMLRIVNSLIASVALFVVVLLTPRSIFIPVLVSWLIVNIPLGFFILSSINPSSWSYIFSYLFLPLFYKVFSNDRSPNSIAISLLVLISAFLLAQEARFDILLFAIIFTTSLLPVIFNYEQMNKRFKRLINLSTLLIASGVTLAIWNRSFLVNFREVKTSNWENLTGVSSLIAGAFGGWGLGSLETTMPAITFILSFVTVLSIIYIALREINISESISLVLLSFFGFIVPLFVLVRSNLRVGEWFQPRYILPIYYVLIGLSLILIFKTLATYKLMIFINFIFLISTIAFITALHTVYRRYTIGLDNYSILFFEPNSWWWDFNYLPSPIIIYLLTVIIFITFWLLVRKDILAESRLVSSNDSEQNRN
jgi:hypothetical protein